MSGREGRTVGKPSEPASVVEQLDHLVWVPELRFAFRAGVEVQAMCGLWVEPWDYDGEQDDSQELDRIGGVVAVFERNDCAACHRVHDRASMAWLLSQGTGR